MTFNNSSNKFPFKEIVIEIFAHEIKKIREIPGDDLALHFIFQNDAFDSFVKNMHLFATQYFHHIIYSLKVSLLKTGSSKINEIIVKDLIKPFIESNNKIDIERDRLKPFFIASNLVLNGKKFFSKFPEECNTSKMILNHFKINKIEEEFEYEDLNEVVNDIFDNMRMTDARKSIFKHLRNTNSINNFILPLVLRVAKQADYINAVYDSTNAKNFLNILLNVILNPILRSDIPHNIERVIAILIIDIIKSGYCARKSQNKLVKRASKILDLIFGGKYIQLTWLSLATILIQACDAIFQQKNNDGFSLTILKLFSIFEIIKHTKISEYKSALKMNIFIKFNLLFVELEESVLPNSVEHERLVAILDSIFSNK